MQARHYTSKWTCLKVKVEVLNGIRFSQGDSSDALYVLLSGRLRSVYKHSTNEKHMVGEYGRGDLVGLVSSVCGYSVS